MDQSQVVKTLLCHSGLNIFKTLSGLVSDLETSLQTELTYHCIGNLCEKFQTVKELLGVCNCDEFAGSTTEQLSEVISNIVSKVCLPVTALIHISLDARPDFLVLLGHVGHILAECSRLDPSTLTVLLTKISAHIDTYLKERPTCFDLEKDSSLVDIHTLLEVLRTVLSMVHVSVCEKDKQVSELTKTIFFQIAKALDFLSVDLIGSVAISVLIRCLKVSIEAVEAFLVVIWGQVVYFSSHDDDRKQYLILCGFANHFFPTSGNCSGYDIRRKVLFWNILQNGLQSKDSVNRKRALYLLKRIVDICESIGANVETDPESLELGSNEKHIERHGVVSDKGIAGLEDQFKVFNTLDKKSEDSIDDVEKGVTSAAHFPVFWWHPSKGVALAKVWEDFMLIAEVLEEKQVHVIRPLLPRVKNLVKACELPDNGGHPLLHTSWLKSVLYRSSRHESLQIMRWASDTVLSLDLKQCPVLEQGLDEYLTGEMLFSLREAKLYVREPGSPVGCMPPIADKLVQFFKGCWASLSPEHRGAYFCRTIQNVCEGEWGPIPLVFICRGLASLPAAPCLDKTTVLATRKLLTGYLVAVETYFRGIIQVYTVRILLKLIDKNKVPLEDFLQILTLVKRDECFLKGTKIWQETVDFLAGEEISDPNSKGVAYEAMGTDIGPASSWTGPGVKAILEQGLTKYLDTELDSRYSSADHIPALTVARLLMLTANESMATKLRDECPCATLRQACQKIAGIVNAINNHVYMSQHKADKAILLLHLLRLEMGLIGMDKMDPASLVIQDTVTTCRDELLVYISRRTLEDLKEMDDVPLLDLYMDSIDMVARAATLSPVKFTNLVNTCTTCLSRLAVEQSLTLHRKLQQLSCMSIMGAVANFLSCDTANQRYLSVIGQFKEFLQKWTIMTSFSKPTAEKSLSQQEWGKLASQFLQNQWQVVMVTIVKGGAPWCALTELLPLAIETLSVGVEETAIVVLKCLIQIIPKVVSEGSCPDASLCQILESSWACVQEARRIPSFWNVLEAFVQVAYLPCLLSFPKDSLVIQNLRNYADKLIEQGVDKNGVVNVLANQIYRALFPPDMIRHAGKFVGLIIDLCMFGGLVRRGVRQVYEICAALKEAGEDCPENTLLLPINNEDIQVKIKVTSLLCHLDPADSTHCCLATEVVQLCCAQYVKVADGSTNRFANSLVHRQRHRLIQTVLLLQELVTMESVEPLWEFSWSSLEVETQPSIRHMLEWLIVWAMYRHKHLRHKIWALFEKFHDTKNLTMCSLLGIVIHLGPHLPADEQEEYYSRSMQHILPWCMAHHFQTRIYSQAVLVKLWEQSAQLGLHQIHTRNPILQTMVDFNQSNCNSTKNVKRLLDSFFFKFLDFKKDFMLETLYYIMPKMTALTEEDWIHPKLFTLENPHWTEGGPPKFIGVENERNKFKECDPAQWRYLTMRNFEDVEDIDGGGGGDVQKKIMPWQQMALEEDVVAEVEHGVKPPVGAGLVVVTSLINKVPNLGGLCRTSEIFGVSEYVLGKLQYAEDKAFQGLSVTAHKWIPITEVHEDKLSDYLQHKRLEGYTLVGVEQTAHSVCLTEYTFPTKTLLLLGNEKEGIPVELISLLDVCVEIPQQGVVRSLNVHVSGAILIWEYRRQQLMKNAAAS